jgi:tellurite resistance protein TehA-like permease
MFYCNANNHNENSTKPQYMIIAVMESMFKIMSNAKCFLTINYMWSNKWINYNQTYIQQLKHSLNRNVKNNNKKK